MAIFEQKATAVLPPVGKGAIFAGLEGASSSKMVHWATHHLWRCNWHSLPLPNFFSLGHTLGQDKQLPSGALNRSSNGEAQCTLWLSRVSPMPGSWSLTAYPKSLSAGEPRRIATRILLHSLGRSTSRNRRLGDCLQTMVKQQGKL
jgi:hypothetical protein